MNAVGRGIVQADDSHANSRNMLNENRARSSQNNQNSLRKGHWSVEEDILLIQFVRKYGEGRWSKLAKAAGLQRCGKSCRLRWVNYLRPDIKRGHISEEEERLIIELHSLVGNRWSLIAMNLPGRSDNEIKNYWRSHIKKKLKLMDDGGDVDHINGSNIIFGSSSNEYKYANKAFNVDNDKLNCDAFNEVDSTNTNIISYFEDAYHQYNDESLLGQEGNMLFDHSTLGANEGVSYYNIKTQTKPNCSSNDQAISNYVTKDVPHINYNLNGYGGQFEFAPDVTMSTMFRQDDNTSRMMYSTYMQISCNGEHQMFPNLCKKMSNEDLVLPSSFLLSSNANNIDKNDGNCHINMTTNEQCKMCNEEHVIANHDINLLPQLQQEVLSIIDPSLQWNVEAMQPIVEMQPPSSPIIEHNYVFELWGGTSFHVGAS